VYEKFILLIPLAFNDGSRVPRRMLTDIRDELFVEFAGSTIQGTVEGDYMMSDGAKQTDISQLVWVLVEEGREDRVQVLRRTVKKWGRKLGQESMYLERTGSTVELLPCDDREEG
jgi:hypothetical protein